MTTTHAMTRTPRTHPMHPRPVRAVAIVGLATMLTAGLATTATAQLQVAWAPTPTRVSSDADPSDDPMPGMDMPAEDMPAHDVPPEQQPVTEPPGHDMEGMTSPAQDTDADEHESAVSRPRGLVLSTFAAVNAAVLLSAAFVRRRSLARPGRRRVARPSAPTPA
ncbi:hypothetical protein [Pengzhenrongella sicca]|uniref:Uncharacterized protein n=1 Tax=Pengzhenrongella sicca TaxID=2819238 RepID=A0A8A4ZB57_9MICO|nr:hypothetical protein [Pengzhenrongella sicca]QTE28113.1 hypothetical protein J4E96_12000 [Pengzhenrongella sicca]